MNLSALLKIVERDPVAFYSYAKTNLWPVVASCLKGTEIEGDAKIKFCQSVSRELYMELLSGSVRPSSISELEEVTRSKALLSLAHTYLQSAQKLLHPFHEIDTEDKKDVFQESCLSFKRKALEDMGNDGKRSRRYFLGIVKRTAQEFGKKKKEALVREKSGSFLEPGESSLPDHLIDMEELIGEEISSIEPMISETNIQGFFDRYILHEIKNQLSEKCHQIIDILIKKTGVNSVELAEMVGHSKSDIRNKKKKCVDSLKQLWKQHQLVKYSSHG